MDQIDPAEVGQYELDLIHPQGASVARQLCAPVPGLGDYLIGDIYGKIYARPGLDRRSRQLIILSTLLALGGCETPLRLHTKAALRAGLASGEIREVLLQAAPYAGLPRVLSALDAVCGILGDETTSPPAPLAVVAQFIRLVSAGETRQASALLTPNATLRSGEAGVVKGADAIIAHFESGPCDTPLPGDDSLPLCAVPGGCLFTPGMSSSPEPSLNGQPELPTVVYLFKAVKGKILEATRYSCSSMGDWTSI
ncbi:carboxymuconolactone decarboxylase family protein [Streptomyces sp. AK02-04a]|uniref:carboxymuconolactone decarboxylase family protein n=1 Tax=Streptomyces sp. AK02-04a TaxID=3028649 RepID=UPI0029BE030F|nr:carboxymuconolactone decarboxylase family protein [Streptomyces sp. AK02-04a]MDX3763529.1 carboxymuconolactone decarboxylase family protein [Streptomyces sp. AK02-04a]